VEEANTLPISVDQQTAVFPHALKRPEEIDNILPKLCNKLRPELFHSKNNSHFRKVNIIADRTKQKCNLIFIDPSPVLIWAEIDSYNMKNEMKTINVASKWTRSSATKCAPEVDFKEV
jgi:hypothetical protein